MYAHLFDPRSFVRQHCPSFFPKDLEAGSLWNAETGNNFFFLLNSSNNCKMLLLIEMV